MNVTALVDESGQFGSDPIVAVGGVLLPTDELPGIGEAMVKSLTGFDADIPFMLHHAWLNSLAFTVIIRVDFGGAQPADPLLAEALMRVYHFADKSLRTSVSRELAAGSWPDLAWNGACKQIDRSFHQLQQAAVDAGDLEIQNAFAQADAYRLFVQSNPLKAAAAHLAEHPAFAGAVPVFAASESNPRNWALQPLPASRIGGDDRYLTLLALALERCIDLAGNFGAKHVYTQVCTRHVAAPGGKVQPMKSVDVAAALSATQAAHATKIGSRGRVPWSSQLVDYPRPGAALAAAEMRDQVVLYLADAAANRMRLAFAERGQAQLEVVHGQIESAIPGGAAATMDPTGNFERSHLAATFPARPRVLTGSWPSEGAPPMRIWAKEQANSW